jgi:hypothetical protein
MQRMLATVVRHRLPFLLAVLAAVVVLDVLRLAGIPVVSTVSLVLLGVLWVGLALGSILVLNARQARTFQVRDGAFTTPPPVSAVLTVGAFTAMCAAIAGETIHEVRHGWGVDAFQVTVVVLLAVLLPVQWWGVLGRFGLFLRPDGLLDRQPLGSLFVPWEAGAAAEPTALGVKLRLAHPDLIVRRGWRPGTTVRTGIDRGFTAWTVNLYAARPDFRPAIGTGEGLLRLDPTPPAPA